MVFKALQTGELPEGLAAIASVPGVGAGPEPGLAELEALGMGETHPDFAGAGQAQVDWQNQVDISHVLKQELQGILSQGKPSPAQLKRLGQKYGLGPDELRAAIQGG
jgi:hypothetical protein